VGTVTKRVAGARRVLAQRRDVRTLRVVDVMSPHLVTAPPTETVLGAGLRMSRAGVQHLPVVDDAGHCLGVVDLPSVAVAWPSGAGSRGTTVGHLLAGRPTPVLRAGQPLAAAADAMTRSGADGLPVVAEDERLVGIVTAWDLVRALAGRGNAPDAATLTAEVTAQAAGWTRLTLP
jgi:CBS domain-containing protein